MAGLPKIKVFEYDLNGQYLKTYESVTDFSAEYFTHKKGKTHLFNRNLLGKNYRLGDKTIAFEEMIEPKIVKKIILATKKYSKDRLYPKDKNVYHKLILNKDFANIQKEKVKEVMEPFYLKPGESESEYIKRIQEMNLDKSVSQCLKFRK